LEGWFSRGVEIDVDVEVGKEKDKTLIYTNTIILKVLLGYERGRD